MSGYVDGAAAGLELAGLLAERAGREGRPLEFVRSEVERMRLELTWLSPSVEEGDNTMAIMDAVRRPRRDNSPVVAQIEAQRQAVDRVRRALAKLDEDYTRSREALVARLDDAERKLDGRRRALVDECAAAWRAEAERLRMRADRTDPEATHVVVLTRASVSAATVREPRLVLTRDHLLELAARADRRAERLEASAADPQYQPSKPGLVREGGRPVLVRGMVGEALGRLAASLEWPSASSGDDETEEVQS